MTDWVTRGPAQSRGWRVFACVVLLVNMVVSCQLAAESGGVSRSSIVTFVAALGVASYAFGYRVGHVLFWRGFAIIFAVFTIIKLTRLAVPRLQLFASEPSAHLALAVATVIVLLGMGAMVLALLRHAGLVGTGKRTPGRDLTDIFS